MPPSLPSLKLQKGEQGGHRDGGDGDRHVAGVGELEFLEEDHGAGVGGDGQGFDLGRAVGEEEEEAEGQFRHFGGWCGETGEEIGVVKGAKGEDRVGAKDARQ
jgi:hypothetical protein